jgi:sugar lactone lactonase YvrE
MDGSVRATEEFLPPARLEVMASARMRIVGFGRVTIAVALLSALTLALAGSASGVGGNDTIVTVAELEFPNWPAGLASDKAGNIYVSADRYVYKIAPNGQPKIFAGRPYDKFKDPSSDDIGDNGPATDALLSSPSGLAVGPSGSLYIAEWAGGRVRKVSPGGKITTFADARTAKLEYPRDVAVDAFENVYIADNGTNQILKVTPALKVTTVAGTGVEGYTGDGGPATQATLKAPNSVEVSPSGWLYVADTGNHVIRRVSPQPPMAIETIVGTGAEGSSGDGGLPTQATLSLPRGLALDKAGNLYIADYWAERIRKVTPGKKATASSPAVQPKITTIAGPGEWKWESNGDWGPAKDAWLASPIPLAVLPSGSLVIGEGSMVVRMIKNSLPHPLVTGGPFASWNHTFNFDATSSYDVYGAITSYKWDFGDREKASGPKVTHKYAAVGAYSAILTVTDDSGVSVSGSKVVCVEVVLPCVKPAKP